MNSRFYQNSVIKIFFITKMVNLILNLNLVTKSNKNIIKSVKANPVRLEAKLKLCNRSMQRSKNRTDPATSVI